METISVPIHNFSKDDKSSIPFKFIKLETKSNYDSSVPHRHNYYELFIFLKGKGAHTIDFEEHPILSRSIHIVSPGQVHQVNRSFDSYGYVILFSRDFFYEYESKNDSLFDNPLLNNGYAQPVINLKHMEFDRIVSLTDQIAQEYESDKFHRTEVIHCYLKLLLMECERIICSDNTNKIINNSVFNNFRKLLEEGFQEFRSVAHYADQLNISENQLGKIVKESTGKTPIQLIHERVILEAKRLLLHSDYHIKEIAYFLNFDDPSHFGKFFKSKLGYTPLEYRTISQ